MEPYNFVYHQDYWEEAARTNPFARILSKYSQEKFWKTQPKIPGLTKDMVFLDFGCGIGRITRSVAPLVKEYCGVDFSEEMIEKAKSYHVDYSNAEFFVNTGYDLHIFDDNAFDYVHECLVFIHIQKEHIVEYIKEIHRVLKPGGIICTVNFPKQEKYYNGFSLDEAQKVFSNFKEINIKDAGEWYYSIRCEK